MNSSCDKQQNHNPHASLAPGILLTNPVIEQGSSVAIAEKFLELSVNKSHFWLLCNRTPLHFAPMYISHISIGCFVFLFVTASRN